MNQKNPFFNPSLNKTMSPEQFDQVVEAIIAGKYSWACVLLLRFAGHNPLHYIPYRTYNRLVKENDLISRPSRHGTNSINSVGAVKFNGTASHTCLNQISDLSHLEKISEQHTPVGGRNLEQWLSVNFQEYSPLKVELVPDKIKEFLFATNQFFQKP